MNFKQDTFRVPIKGKGIRNKSNKYIVESMFCFSINGKNSLTNFKHDSNFHMNLSGTGKFSTVKELLFRVNFYL